MPFFRIKYINMENRVYTCFDADTIIPETLGIFSNKKKHLIKNIDNFQNIQCVKKIHKDNKYCFESYTGWKTLYFYPICSKENWEAYKHYINGGTVMSPNLCLYSKKQFNQSKPDWLNTRYRNYENFIERLTKEFHKIELRFTNKIEKIYKSFAA